MLRTATATLILTGACLGAGTPSKWPIIHVVKEKQPEGERNNNGSVLTFKMLKGSPGTLAVYHKAPQFHEQGALLGQATTPGASN